VRVSRECRYATRAVLAAASEISLGPWQGEVAHAAFDAAGVVAQVRLSGGESVMSQHEAYVLEAGSLVVEDPRERAAQMRADLAHPGTRAACLP
jgi:hypothetical protein